MVAGLPIIHPYHHALNAEVGYQVFGSTTEKSNWVVPVPSQHLDMYIPSVREYR